MIFKPGYRSDIQLNENSRWILFHDDRILLTENGDRIQPIISTGMLGKTMPDMVQFLGKIDGADLFTGEIPGNVLPGSLRWTIRSLYDKIDRELFWIAARAYHLHNWNKNSVFCSRCGKPAGWMEEDRAKKCPECGFSIYPRISPAVITAIVRDGKILLARSSRFPGVMHSVIAGFVEPGENLEECVRREIREEVGLEVKNIRYFASQPWPFPDSLMVGFVTDYESGEIKIDEKEIVAADWYGPDNLPNIPGNISIARKLIDWFVEEYAK